jgi:hypothetical protein
VTDAGTALVTIVIPVWGAYADGWLDEAIASIRDQEVAVSIMLVDNAHEPPLRRKGLSVIRTETRLSIGAARNLGLQSVRTPFVVVWDADDVMLPGTLPRLLDRLARDPELVACSPSIVEYPDGRLHHWPRRWPLALTRFPRLFATANAVTSLYPAIGAALRTLPAQQTAFPDANGGDDWAIGAGLAFRGQIAVDPHPGRRYRRHHGSVSARWTTENVMSSAGLLRRSLSADQAVPAPIRRALPLMALAHHGVLRVLRPLSRRMGRRRAA